jgi:hypothetical protein
MMKRSKHSAWLRNLFAVIAIIAFLGFGMTPRAARAVCVGDCNGIGGVTVDEILTMVNIALGNVDVSLCTAGDESGDGHITVDEILRAVNNALNGCPPEGGCGDGAVGTGEECDNGGTCIGGQDAGKHCTAESQCAGNGVCVGGSKSETACDPTNASACPGGTCKKCVPQGGNGCAANCTTETEVVMNLVPGEIQGVSLVPGTSGATVYNGVLGPIALPFQPGATQTMAIGKARNGQIPVIVLAASVHFPKIDVSGLACACVRGVGAKSCGGMQFNADGSGATDCTDGFTAGASLCPVNLPCAFVHGNGGSCSNAAKTCGQDSNCPGGTCVLGGNSASGIFSCVAGLQGVDLSYTQDSRGTTDPPRCSPNDPDWTATTGSEAGLCGDPPVLTLSGTGPAGSASILNTTAIGQVVSGCDANPVTFCTDADPIEVRGTPTTLPLVTGTTSAEMFNINATETSCRSSDHQCVVGGVADGTPCSGDADCGDTLCNCPAGYYSCDRALCSGPLTLPGQPLASCDQLTGASPNVTGLGLASAFTSLSTPTINDIVVTDLLKAQ